MQLSELSKGATAIVSGVQESHPGDLIARRLRDLGFVRGESVRLVARAPWGGDPMLITIGFTRFALRRSEAARVQVVSEAEFSEQMQSGRESAAESGTPEPRPANDEVIAA